MWEIFNKLEKKIRDSDVQSKSNAVKSDKTPKENLSQAGSKRSLTSDDISDVINKKPKLSSPVKDAANNNKVNTLIDFWKYMQSKNLKNKLTRSDLEQFCLQKICEFIIHKTDVGELHQTIKKQENHIDVLRKDVQQLTKQCRDLDIVNKKLMNELKVQNANKKPLVPLKITRSVGLQVKLNTAVEQSRRNKPVATTPNRPSITTTATSVSSTTPTTTMVRPRVIPPANSNVVRQVTSTSPRKPTTPSTPTTTANSNPILSQVLQTSPRPAPVLTTATQKRTPVRKVAESPKQPTSGNPGVIDLTDEDDKTAKSTTGTPVKILNKKVQMIAPSKVQVKGPINKTANGQTKTVVTGKVAPSKGTPVRTVTTTLSQGVRLTTPGKNGITIPASVVTSAPGTPQLMYVVQPSQIVTSTAGGGQKTVLLNIPGNSILTSALNGSAVSVIPTKTTNSVQLKTVASSAKKHPAPLPQTPYVPTNLHLKPLLPKPVLSIRKTDTGIILQWRMPYNLDQYEGIASYQLFAYQETNAQPSTEMWRKVGDVKALALPMACTLTQFADKNKYYFAVRSVDVYKRIGAFSDPEEISL